MRIVLGEVRGERGGDLRWWDPVTEQDRRALPPGLVHCGTDPRQPIVIEDLVCDACHQHPHHLRERTMHRAGLLSEHFPHPRRGAEDLSAPTRRAPRLFSCAVERRRVPELGDVGQEIAEFEKGIVRLRDGGVGDHISHLRNGESADIRVCPDITHDQFPPAADQLIRSLTRSPPWWEESILAVSRTRGVHGLSTVRGTAKDLPTGLTRLRNRLLQLTTVVRDARSSRPVSGRDWLRRGTATGRNRPLCAV
jgi:hypothetical protein